MDVLPPCPLTGSEPTRRRRAVGVRAAAATLLLGAALAGCGAAEQPSSKPEDGDLGSIGVGPGTYGPACPRLPAGGGDFPGTAAELITAAATGEDPLLSTLGRGLDATGLRVALADPAARYTVFAPADAAFEELPAGTVQEWLTAPRDELYAVLAHHVVVPRYDAQALAAGPDGLETLDDQPLVVTGDPRRLVVDEEQQAGVLCGNITTTNATVFIIDRVLLPDPGR